LGVWPEVADGTDINAVDVSEETAIVAVADDFGRVRDPVHKTLASS
jgi:hypothetical protein